MQKKDQSVETCKKNFISILDPIQSYMRVIWKHLSLIDAELQNVRPNPENLTLPQCTVAESTINQAYYMGIFILGLDPIRFKKLRDNLFNSYMVGRDEYPKTINRATSMLMVYRIPNSKGMRGSMSQEQQEGIFHRLMIVLSIQHPSQYEKIWELEMSRK